MKKKINIILISICGITSYLLVFQTGNNLFLLLCLFLLSIVTYLTVNAHEKILAIKYLVFGRGRVNEFVIIIILPFIHVILDLIKTINPSHDEKKNIFFLIICLIMTLLVFGVKNKDAT